MTDPLADRRLRLVAGSSGDAAAVLALLDSTMITVMLPEGQPEWRHQVLAVALVDLLGRLFPLQEIVCSPDAVTDPALPPGPAQLIDRLRAAAGNGALRDPETSPTQFLTVVIGNAIAEPVAGGAPDQSVLHVDGGGWQAYTGTDPSRLPDGPWPTVPIGALAASCRAAGQITATALEAISGPVSLQASAYASALTHAASADPIDEGPGGTPQAWTRPDIDAVLAGAGSVGGALAYTLAMTPDLTGRLVVCDPQRLEDKNLDRALLATAAATAAGLAKVDVVKDALAHHGDLEVDSHPAKFSDWVGSHAAPFALPVVLITVDALEERRAIQDSPPLDVLNAACNPNEVTISGHRTDDGPCVCCLHMGDVLNAEMVKATMIAKDTGVPRLAVVQHLTNRQPMPALMVRQIERNRGITSGALAQYENQTLLDLWNGYLLYGSTQVQAGAATVAVAAPYITALAGTLLAGELLKGSVPDLRALRIGPHGPTIKYEEHRLYGPLNALRTNPERWHGAECLCRSTRRQRLLAARYSLTPR